MRLVRTAAGGFLNVEKIERLVDERGEVAGSWTAICAAARIFRWPPITARLGAPSASCSTS